jgi:hypothetical protein
MHALVSFDVLREMHNFVWVNVHDILVLEAWIRIRLSYSCRSYNHEPRNSI